MISFNDGIPITFQEALNQATYEQVGWDFSVWKIQDGFPTLNVSYNQITPSWFGQTPFPDSSALGVPITLQESLQASTYTQVGWDFNIWSFENGRLVLRIDYNQITPSWFGQTPFPDSNALGVPITLQEARRRSTYLNVGWNFFGTVENPKPIWYIQDGRSFPSLSEMVCNYVPPGKPNTAVRGIVLVDKHPRGSMIFKDEVWKHIQSIIVDGHTTKQQEGSDTVIMDYIGDEIVVRNVRYKFLASGIRDLNGCGGYGSYTTDKFRVVPFSNEYAQRVNFYYAPVDLPDWHEAGHLSIAKEDGEIERIKLYRYDDTVVEFSTIGNFNRGGNGGGNGDNGHGVVT